MVVRRANVTRTMNVRRRGTTRSGPRAPACVRNALVSEAHVDDEIVHLVRVAVPSEQPVAPEALLGNRSSHCQRLFSVRLELLQDGRLGILVLDRREHVVRVHVSLHAPFGSPGGAVESRDWMASKSVRWCSAGFAMADPSWYVMRGGRCRPHLGAGCKSPHARHVAWRTRSRRATWSGSCRSDLARAGRARATPRSTTSARGSPCRRDTGRCRTRPCRRGGQRGHVERRQHHTADARVAIERLGDRREVLWHRHDAPPTISQGRTRRVDPMREEALG